MISSIHLIKDEPDPENTKELLQVMERSSKLLLNIVNDILDLSKIEAGKLKYEKLIFNYKSIIKDCLKIYQYSAEGKELSLTLDYQADDDFKSKFLSFMVIQS